MDKIVNKSSLKIGLFSSASLFAPIVSITFIFTIAYAGYIYLRLKHPMIALLIGGCGLLQLLSIYMNKSFHLIKAPSYLFLSSTALTIWLVGFYTGGSNSSELSYLVILPMAAYFLSLRVRDLVFGFSATIFGYAAMALCGYFELLPEIPVTEHSIEWARIASNIGIAIFASALSYIFAQQRIAAEFSISEKHIKLEMLIKILAHDIKNPCGASVVLAELSADTNDTGKLHITLDKIRAANQEVIDISNEVLVLTALDSGKIVPEVVPIEVAPLIDKVIHNYNHRLREKSIEVKVHGDLHGILAVGDQMALEYHVIGNILSNAIKFSHPNSRIGIHIKDADKSNITISIRDHGVGIPAALMPILFDPAIKTSRPGTKAERGTGFGLILARKYTEAMGGKLTISSIEQKGPGEAHGTTVVITLTKALPFAESAASTA